MHHGDAATVGAPGRARCGLATRPDDGRTAAVKRAGARESRAEARERDLAQGVGVFCSGGAQTPSEVMVGFIEDHREVYEGVARRVADLYREVALPA